LFTLKRGKNEVKMRKLAQKRERNLPKEWMAGSAVYETKKAKISLKKHNKRAKYILEKQITSLEKTLQESENGGEAQGG
jgi:IS5 family transposase